MQTQRLKSLACALTLGAFLSLPGVASAQTSQSLENEVRQLRQQLAQKEQQLAEARAAEERAQENAQAAEARAGELQQQLEDVDPGPSKIQIGDFAIGGAIRANYVIGDYAGGGEGPNRGGHGGNVELDTFRINIDYANGPWLGKVEYRFYNGYNMLHTGWFGYQIDENAAVQVGVNRVPFGPGPYGVSNSWFFDQHYYVGLSDDMDLGVKYTRTMGNLTLDVAYYITDEGNWRGASNDSARYSYDMVESESGVGYNEQHQFNVRAIYSMGDIPVPTDLGVSLQYGLLDGKGIDDDGDSYAASIHMKNSLGNWGLKTQLTWYNHDTDFGTNVGTGAFNPDLILMGAYDFAWPVAAEAFIPAIALNYLWTTDNIDWLDSVNFYAEYSSIMKSGNTLSGADFNDSDLFILGAAWARGGWYIYTDLAYSNGNYFVGNEAFTEFGANPNDEWQYRFNINFGYYF